MTGIKARAERKTLSPEIREAVLERARGRCEVHGPRCLGRATEVDHIWPRAKGGTNDSSNLQASCRPCNQWKKSRVPDGMLPLFVRPAPAPAPATPPKPPNVLTPEEAATYLGVPLAALKSAAGPPVVLYNARVRRYRREALDRWLAEREIAEAGGQ